MPRLMQFPTAVRHDPAVDAWMQAHAGPLGELAQRWFDVMRRCGDDVKELIHDGHPTACVGDAAFAEVDAFTHHVNVGLFLGAEMEDPARLLEGTGRFMRHVKLRPGADVDAAALQELIARACIDMRALLATARAGGHA